MIKQSARFKIGEFLAKHEFDTVLDLCLMLHMSNTGASDPVPPEFEEEALERLLDVIEHWQPSIPMSENFDNAVYELIDATLAECLLKPHRHLRTP